MTSVWRSRRRVSECFAERDGRLDDLGNVGAQSPRVAKMTAVDVLGRVDELTDGTGGSVDAVMGAAIGPYRKSRRKSPSEWKLIVSNWPAQAKFNPAGPDCAVGRLRLHARQGCRADSDEGRQVAVRGRSTDVDVPRHDAGRPLCRVDGRQADGQRAVQSDRGALSARILLYACRP